jgi:hypothetical protein
MENPYLVALAQYVVGLTTCQNLLLQYLIKKGTVNKTEISNALDFLIDEFNKTSPTQAITLAMAGIRQGLEKDLPDFPPPPPENQRPKAKHPDWLKGIIQGGKK